ncbi:tachylectin-related carbohydrate-binding protein [Yinghuangia soli]|uniref:Tachylectin n=1 Tax=Yinghuangia soli TaxID=2908204 RepID=A0AA41PX28_9ACTN|nr:tachylectin-related carbohydrate-binding protein [Yinghuangia soli]MCF2527328.1 hypothetical protein [Yinghuangia soli]
MRFIRLAASAAALATASTALVVLGAGPAVAKCEELPTSYLAYSNPKDTLIPFQGAANTNDDGWVTAKPGDTGTATELEGVQVSVGVAVSGTIGADISAIVAGANASLGTTVSTGFTWQAGKLLGGTFPGPATKRSWAYFSGTEFTVTKYVLAVGTCQYSVLNSVKVVAPDAEGKGYRTVALQPLSEIFPDKSAASQESSAAGSTPFVAYRQLRTNEFGARYADPRDRVSGTADLPTPPEPEHPDGVASVYGILADGRLTYTSIDVANGNRAHLSISTRPLGFTPKALATLNFNTLLVTSTAGRLYRVDVDSVSTGTLTFAAPVDLGGGWTHDLLTYDGSGKLFGIAAGTLRRYTVHTAKPTASGITGDGIVGTGFTLKTLTSTAPDWILGTTADGQLLTYKINGVGGNWTRHQLRSSTWENMTHLASPGSGVLYGRHNSSGMYHYWDMDPTDGSGTDLIGYANDPVDSAGWSQILLSANPNAL